MISIFREHNIIPIFVFDGKPPVEKNDTIEFRKKTKRNAREEYYRLKQILNDIESDVMDVSENESSNTTTVELDEETTVSIPSKSEDIRMMMDKLKKKFVILKSEHIQNAKTLLQAYGMTYIESPGEADMLCAKLVSKNIVYACLSEDTDMFVYGCSRVLRYLSLTSWTAILYDFPGIITTLDMTLYEFQQLCIMYGCDYLPKNEKQHYKHMTIFNSYKLFKNYKEYYKNAMTEYNNLFDISHYDNLELYDNVKIMNGPIDRKRLIEVMEKENFIFIS